MNKIEAIVRLRRDNDFNYEKIKDTFIPASGEVVFVDTARDGLRAKVGDGYSTFSQLQFVDEDLRNMVLQGYFDDNIFYRDDGKNVILAGMVNKLYIDKPTRRIYFFDGTNYIPVTEHIQTATADTPGVVKLYHTTGQNVDGTMTQKAITDELDVRYKTEVVADDELLIFSI